MRGWAALFHFNNMQEKLSLKAKLKKLLVIIFVVLGFFLLAAFLIALLRLSQKGFSVQVFHEAVVFAKKVVFNPFYLGEIYADWGKKFYRAWLNDKLTGNLYIPIVFPVLLMAFLGWKTIPFYKKLKEYFKPVGFSPSQLLHESKMLYGKYSVLGCLSDNILQMPKNQSLLVLGNDSGGKTSSVCVPTLLKADESCIVAVSSQNELAELTSGYRSGLGPVFYFNWGLSDAPEKNEFYPRWNPLAYQELPPKGKNREEYLKGLSRYLILYNTRAEIAEDDYWLQLAGRALFGLLNFFVAKIERAAANDYFLGTLLDKGRLSPEDRRLLLSYYVIMNKEYAAPAIENLEQGNLNKDNYLPIGSWEGVPLAWQGKELCLSMFADWLLQCFLTVKSQEKQVSDTWKIVLEYCWQEADFFGYGNMISEILQQIFYLSQKQRSVIFPMLFHPLSVFRVSSVRERTSTCDFSPQKIRTTYDDKVNTVYCVSGDKNINFINKLFVDVMLYYSFVDETGPKDRPLLFIFDNLEQQAGYKFLSRSLKNAEKYNVGFVLTATSVSNLQFKYSQNALENIINETQYKILLSENMANAASELKKMSCCKAVGTSDDLVPNIRDASYYRKVAKSLSSLKKNLLEKDEEILLLPNFYKMPFKISSAFFGKFDALENMATFDAAYFLDEKLLKKRNVQDMETPELLTILRDSGCELDDVEGIDIYLDDKYEQAVETIEQVSDKESVLADDISSRWRNNPPSRDETGKDWWLNENAFDFSDEKENANPFLKK